VFSIAIEKGVKMLTYNVGLSTIRSQNVVFDDFSTPVSVSEVPNVMLEVWNELGGSRESNNIELDYESRKYMHVRIK
jgi:hypothetical protein